MTAVYLFAGLLALLVAVGLLVSPLLEREPSPADEASPEERRDQELEALREVEFEYRTGKLSEDDYRELKARHGEAAVRARREAGGDGSGGAAGGDEGPDAKKAPGDGEPTAAGGSGEPGETSGAQRPGEARHCPSCGAETRPHARFCSRCGESLEGGSG